MTFDKSKLPGGDRAFPSSGDPDVDDIVAQAVRAREANLAEGICPNGCGPIERACPGELYCASCRWRGYGYDGRLFETVP
jgi:hypothetical protein